MKSCSDVPYELHAQGLSSSGRLLLFLRILASTDKALLEDLVAGKRSSDEPTGFIADQNEAEMRRFLDIRCKMLLRGYSSTLEVCPFLVPLWKSLCQFNWKLKCISIVSRTRRGSGRPGSVGTRGWRCSSAFRRKKYSPKQSLRSRPCRNREPHKNRQKKG